MTVAVDRTPHCLDCREPLAGGERAMLFMVVGRGSAALCETCAARYDTPDSALRRLRAAVAAMPERAEPPNRAPSPG